MINKIKEIGRALDAQCYHCALALALTLPDICGRVAYPNMSSLEQRKERYEKWFDTYVATQYFCSSNLNLPQNKNVLINGYACYLLRCAYLHFGNFDLLSQNNEIHIKKFRLHIDKLSGENGNASFVSHSSVYVNGEDMELDIDVYNLCYAIGQAAIEFYNSTPDKTLFKSEEIDDISWSKGTLGIA